MMFGFAARMVFTYGASWGAGATTIRNFFATEAAVDALKRPPTCRGAQNEMTEAEVDDAAVNAADAAVDAVEGDALVDARAGIAISVMPNAVATTTAAILFRPVTRRSKRMTSLP